MYLDTKSDDERGITKQKRNLQLIRCGWSVETPALQRLSRFPRNLDGLFVTSAGRKTRGGSRDTLRRSARVPLVEAADNANDTPSR